MAARYGATSSEHLRYKPEEFAWENQEQLDQKTQSYLNRQPFSYDLANDPAYKQYKEQYAALGNLAMQDTAGQAAALTGGYGNTWAQTAGQQTYQNYLNKVNEVVPDLYARARSDYEAEGDRLYKEISLLESQKAQAYDRYQADLNDWYNYLSVLQNQEEIARENDRWEQQFAASQEQAQAANSYPDYIIDRLESGFDSDEEKMSYLVGQTQIGAIDSSQMGRLASGYSFGAGSGVPNDFVKANYRRTDDDYAVFDFGDDNEVKLNKGVNPYTRTKNPDVENGTFSNGYQPNNVGGKELSKTGDVVYVNGVKQNVWKTKDGTRYVWDGTENRYLRESEISYDY